MTYAEIFEWIDDQYDFSMYDDLGEMYEQINEEWFGRIPFDSIISPESFFNYFEE
jgi:hypothetical protein